MSIPVRNIWWLMLYASDLGKAAAPSEVLSVIRHLAKDGMTLAIVTHEMDFARDVSNRVFYMDEGTIYEEGTAEQIFESPRRDKTRAFTYRIRSFNRRIASVDYDLYALHGEMEHFCEKHVLPCSRTQDLDLVDELLQLHKAILSPFVVDLSIAYSETSGRLELIIDTADTGKVPLQVSHGGDGLAVAIVRGIAESIEHRRENGRSRLWITVPAS